MKNFGKKIIFVCGFIGSGKTTYANKHYKTVTDLDFMPEFSKKKDQINLTLKLLKYNDKVCHITCFPTDEELQAFKNYDVDFILIDTSLKQAKTNILIRNRDRDIANLNNVLIANQKYKSKFKDSNIPWRKIRVFNWKGTSVLFFYLMKYYL